MAISGTSLLNRIKAAYGNDSEGNPYIQDEVFMKKLCDAIAEEITQNGLVSFANVSTIISAAPGSPVTGTLLNGKIN